MNTKDSRKLQIFQHLTSLSMDLASTLDLDTFLKRIVTSAVEITNSRAGSLLLVGESKNQLYFKVSSDSENEVIKQSVAITPDSVAGWVTSHKSPVIITDVSKNPSYFSHMAHVLDFQIQSLIAAPLTVKGKTIGVLELLNKQQDQYDEDDQTTLAILSSQASVAIENARLFNQADLLSELVHELRTPLTSIATLTYLLQRSATTDDQRKQWTGTILSEIERLNNFATNFLDLARLESGRTNIDRKAVDPKLLLKESIDVVSTKAADSNITITEQIDNDLPHLNLDRDKIKQVIINLLCNAVKYTPQNGKIKITAGMKTGAMVVQIEDNGFGIDPEDMPFIFEKYYRGKHNEKNIQGYGLGLPICKRIINAHDGTIEVSSTPGKGTKFIITLPAA